jgi:hypothetical protein
VRDVRQPAARRTDTSDAQRAPTRAAPITTVAVTLAGLLAWQSIALLVDVDAAATKFRLADTFTPTTARGIVVGIAVVGLVAAVLLVGSRTRTVGATAAAVALVLLGGYLVVVWVRGDPVQCLCSPGTAPRGSLAHLSSIALLLGAGAVAAAVAAAGRRRVEPSAQPPHDA